MAVTKPWLTELEIYHRLVSGVDGVSGVFSPSLPLGVGKCFSTKMYQHSECLLKVVKKQAVAKITDINLLGFLKLLHFLLEKNGKK